MIPSGARASAFAVLLACAASAAQTPEKVYVTRDFKAGLHEEKSADSAITTLVSSGTALDVVKRENPLSFVRTPEGVTGWIDNSYLVATPPTDAAELKQARERADASERRAAELQKQIADLESRPAGGAGATPGTGPQDGLAKEKADLEQALKEERLRAGELQVQISELRKRIGMNSDNASLYDRIGELEAENKQLQVSLSGAAATDGGAANAAAGTKMSARSLAAWLALVLVAGFGGGIYVMDYLNRRRHGGFRV